MRVSKGAKRRALRSRARYVKYTVAVSKYPPGTQGIRERTRRAFQWSATYCRTTELTGQI
jgi:hypothetical protein